MFTVDDSNSFFESLGNSSDISKKKKKKKKKKEIFWFYEHMKIYITHNTLFTNTRYNNKLVIITIWLSRNLRLSGSNWSQIMQEYCFNTFKKHVFDMC